MRDTFGNVRTVSEIAAVTIGVNGAGLFVWGTGTLLGNADVDLGGRSTAEDVTPTGLSGFAGEIAIVNVYDRVLSAADIQLAFDRVATATAATSFSITQADYDDALGTMTLTWESVDSHLYSAEYSADLESWTDLNDDVTADSEETTKTYVLPSNEGTLFIRIRDRGLD